MVQAASNVRWHANSIRLKVNSVADPEGGHLLLQGEPGPAKALQAQRCQGDNHYELKSNSGSEFIEAVILSGFFKSRYPKDRAAIEGAAFQQLEQERKEGLQNLQGNLENPRQVAAENPVQKKGFLVPQHPQHQHRFMSTRMSPAGLGMWGIARRGTIAGLGISHTSPSAPLQGMHSPCTHRPATVVGLQDPSRQDSVRLPSSTPQDIQGLPASNVGLINLGFETPAQLRDGTEALQEQLDGQQLESEPFRHQATAHLQSITTACKPPDPPAMQLATGMRLMKRVIDMVEGVQPPLPDMADDDWLAYVQSFLQPSDHFRAGFISHAWRSGSINSSTLA